MERVDEDGYEPVYNLEVEGTHCFAVEGGIIVHNCMDAMRYLVHTKRLWKPKVDYKSPLERH